eukprot:5099622-Amphidinium_carterae.1
MKDFDILLHEIGGRRVVLGESVWLHFRLPFGASGDNHRVLVISPPIDRSSASKAGAVWDADCSGIFVNQMPELKSCKVGSDIRLEFTHPIKGGTLIFAL